MRDNRYSFRQINYNSLPDAGMEYPGNLGDRMAEITEWQAS
ncbi:hypothetical protein [Pectobacterium brasiliense]